MSCNLHKQNENLEGHKPSSFMDFSMSRGLISWKKNLRNSIRNSLPRCHFFQTSGTFYSAEIHQVLEIPSLNLKMAFPPAPLESFGIPPSIAIVCLEVGQPPGMRRLEWKPLSESSGNHQPHLPLLYKQLQALRKPGIFIIKHHLSQLSKTDQKACWQVWYHSLSQILSEKAFKGSANWA